MKKQTKRIISLILSCLMILSGMTLPAFSADAATASTATEPHTLDFENVDLSEQLSYDKMQSLIGNAEIVSLTTSYVYSISAMSDAAGGNTKVLKFINNGTSEVAVSKRGIFKMYGIDSTNNTTGTWTVDFDFYCNYYDSQYMQLSLCDSKSTAFNTNYDNVIANGKIVGTDTKVNTGWHHINAVINLDEKKMSVKLDNTELSTKQIEYSSNNNLFGFRIGLSTAKGSWWAIDNFSTSWKDLSYSDYCNVSVADENEVRTGKVMTVNAETYPGFTSAKLYLDNIEIASLTENSENTYSVRYLVPEDTAEGSHTVKLVASYPSLDENVEKEQSITIVKKNAPDSATVMNFNDYSSYLGETMTNAEAAAVLGAKAFGNKPTYCISSDADKGYILKAVNNTDASITVANSYIELYAFSDKSSKTNGRFNIDFDFYISHSNWDNTMQVLAKDENGTYWPASNVIASGSVNGISGYLPAGWHSFKGELNLDTMEHTYTVDGITCAKGALYQDKATGISYFRIGLSIYETEDDNVAKSWAFSNVNIGYFESEILASAEYVKGSDSYAANEVIAFDADSVKLNVRKEYAQLNENDVMVEINDNSPVAVNASYAEGAITVPVLNIGIKEGDSIKITVSHDALLADGTYVDEPIVCEFVAGNSDGGAIIVENGKAKAYFGIKSANEESATVYLVAYNGDALEVLTSSAITVLAGASSYESASLTLPSQYDEIKCFVWKNDDIKPYIATIIK